MGGNGGSAGQYRNQCPVLVLIVEDRPLAAVVAGYALSVPYNIVATVGVWRSANRYVGPSLHADLARIATIILMAALTLT